TRLESSPRRRRSRGRRERRSLDTDPRPWPPPALEHPTGEPVGRAALTGALPGRGRRLCAAPGRVVLLRWARRPPSARHEHRPGGHLLAPLDEGERGLVGRVGPG